MKSQYLQKITVATVVASWLVATIVVMPIASVASAQSMSEQESLVPIRDFNPPNGITPAGEYRQVATLHTGVSGLQASRSMPGKFWTISDRESYNIKLIEPVVVGDEFGMWQQSDPNLQGWSFSAAPNRRSGMDFEDLAIGPGPATGNYIYVANMGWNNSYNNPRLHRFLEPTEPAGVLSESQIETFEFKYELLPTGSTADAETLLIDPRNGDVLIVIKGGSHRYLYRLTQAQLADTAVPVKIAERLGTLDVAPVYEQSTWQGAKITGGDVSPNGREVVLRSDKWGIHFYYLYFGESVATALLRRPDFEQLSNRSGYTDTHKRSRYPNNMQTGGQSEAIAFATNRSGFYEMSEGSGASWGGRVLYMWKWK